MGYDGVGYSLASALGAQEPLDAEPGAWGDEVDTLIGLLDSGDDSEALVWFDRHYPKIMALVPRRRRAQFLRGVNRARDEDRIAL